VTVAKATPSVTTAVSPSHIVKNKTKPTVTVTVAAPGQTPTGQVTIWWTKKKSLTQSLSNGATTFTLPPFDTAGSQTLTIDYAGSSTNNAVTRQVQVEVYNN
jgi:hypothetical protein